MHYRSSMLLVMLLIVITVCRPSRAPIGWADMNFVLVILFLLFGHHLPGVMRSLGRAVMDHRRH